MIKKPAEWESGLCIRGSEQFFSGIVMKIRDFRICSLTCALHTSLPAFYDSRTTVKYTILIYSTSTTWQTDTDNKSNPINPFFLWKRNHVKSRNGKSYKPREGNEDVFVMSRNYCYLLFCGSQCDKTTCFGNIIYSRCRLKDGTHRNI